VTTESQQQHMHPVLKRVLGFLAPALMSACGIWWATRLFWPSLATGLAISGAIEAAYWLDCVLIAPRLKNLSREWLRFGLETVLLLLEHIVPALLAVFVCGRIFDFAFESNVAWVVVGGLLIGFPVVHGTQSALHFYRQLKEKERMEERLRALATQAELKALKAQINPHFLFNTLNTVAELTHADPEKAEATIERLAEMFRYVLASSERGLVPLGDELSFVDGYLEIERARFGERLCVSREIARETLGVLVPSLILQPLVENAIRHGHGPGGRVDLSVHIQFEGDEVVIAVADQGPGMPLHFKVKPSHGVGMWNVDERLRKTYGEEYGLEVRDNEPRGTVVVVRIPVGG